jgi:ornithine cyclodeaminase
MNGPEGGQGARLHISNALSAHGIFRMATMPVGWDMSDEGPMTVITAAEVFAAGFPALVEALRRGHRGPMPEVGRSLLERGGASFLVLPAWLAGAAFGVKMVTVLPGNEARTGNPSVQAAYQLFDGATGTPSAVIDGTALTYAKTAADSALGASILARDDAAVLMMVGAGALAPHLVAAHRSVRPSLARVLVWNRTGARAEALAGDLREDGIDAQAVPDLEAAVRAADIVCCATASAEPLVRGGWLAPGAHLDLVGGFTPAMRESDDEAIRRATVFVDTRRFTIDHCGDLSQPIAAGVIEPSDIAADLFELCRGDHPGRRTRDEITLFKNAGGGHLDLFVAMALLERARAG